MRTAALLFFYACLAFSLAVAAAAWAKVAVQGHYAKAGVRYSDDRDPRIDITLATALWKQHEAEWEAELATPYDWQQEGL